MDGKGPLVTGLGPVTMVRGWGPLVGQLGYILSPVGEDNIFDSVSFRSNRVGEEFPREGMMARLKR